MKKKMKDGTNNNVGYGVGLKVDGFADNHGSFGFAVVGCPIGLWNGSSSASSHASSSSTMKSTSMTTTTTI